MLQSPLLEPIIPCFVNAYLPQRIVKTLRKKVKWAVDKLIQTR